MEVQEVQPFTDNPEFGLQNVELVKCMEEEQVVLNVQFTDDIRSSAEDSRFSDWANDLIDVVNQTDEKLDNEDSTRPKDLMSLLNSEAFSENITTQVDKSRGEIFFMILKFCILNSLSSTAMANLFILINTIFKTPILPNSKYYCDKILNPKGQTEFHSLCPHCSAYIGQFGYIKNITNCRSCKREVDTLNPSDTSFFVLIDPSTQIADLLQIYENHYDYVTKERVHEEGYIEDVYDGKQYRKFVNSLPENEKHSYATAMFNTDGAPIFKSSKYSIWPLFLKINELPCQERMNKLITCGLYFNKKKPEMRVFVDKFVDLVNNITKKGIPCTIKNEERLIKLHVVSCCVDAVCRAPLQGIKQYNGSFGCNWCLHSGKYAKGSMRYPFDDSVELRSHSKTVDLMLNPKNEMFGIKYPSPLINFMFFNIVTGFVPDYLHACLEGVAEQFTNYFLKSVSEDELKVLDALMENIAAPQQVQRLCRPLKCRNDYKAREWENFILYYSIPIFSRILPKDKLDHWILFVEALYILLKDKIHVSELNHADALLHTFVFQTEKLYKIEFMTFNVHQLLHICESVANWGPLWTNSTFSFESANYYILKAIKCSKGVTQQLVRFVNISHSFLIVEDYIGHNASQSVSNYCNNILCARVKSFSRTQDILYFGKGDDVEDELLQQYRMSENSRFYSKIVKNRCLYEAYSQSRRRSNNSFAQLSDKQFIRIRGFVVDDDSQRQAVVCNFIYTRDYNSSFNILKRVEYIENNIRFIPINNIERICIFMDVLKQEYIVPLPNLLHY